MKCVLLILSLMLSSVGASPIKSDKIAHAATSSALYFACDHAIKKTFHMKQWLRVTTCAVGVSALGIAKELTDNSRGGRSEVSDVIANTVGIGVSIPLAW